MPLNDHEIIEVRDQLEEWRLLANSRAITNQGDREIVTRVIRLLETLVGGRPQTPITPRHHA